MTDAELTAVATTLLVLVGSAQAAVLVGQRRQQRLDWAEAYRRRWIELKEDWATVVFLGRRHSDYYQIAHLSALRELRKATAQASTEIASSWAQAAVRNVCGMLSDLCLRVLQGQIRVRDVYPMFGTELLRQGAALRVLLDGETSHLLCYGSAGPTKEESRHDNLRREIQTWLVCHDGLRRRCLIMIDLLWAEAARLEDLPPSDLQLAADAKSKTGAMNRARLRAEALRLNGWQSIVSALRLADYLRYSEWKRLPWSRGMSKKRLKKLDEEWTKRYLHT